MSEWQPIKSAPRDATVIWCYLPEHDEQACLRYVTGDGWSGWQYIDSLLNDVLDSELAPSHWMPLPSPPEA